jgi:hypothetical protein
MVIEKQALHTCLYKAKQSFKSGNKDSAREFCDLGIAYIAVMRDEGCKPEDLVEGIKIDLWLTRFWCFLEEKDLLLG